MLTKFASSVPQAGSCLAVPAALGKSGMKWTPRRISHAFSPAELPPLLRGCQLHGCRDVGTFVSRCSSAASATHAMGCLCIWRVRLSSTVCCVLCYGRHWTFEPKQFVVDGDPRPLQHCSTTVLQHYNTTTLQYYNTTVLHHYSTTALQYYDTTVLQQYSTTTIQYYNNTVLQHYCTAVLVRGATAYYSTYFDPTCIVHRFSLDTLAHEIVHLA